MSSAGNARVCSECADPGRHHAKGLCARCYAKARERLTTCTDCGELRRLHRRGRCSRCYRHAQTSMRVCGRCGQHRRMWQDSETCRACQNLARAASGACSDCGRVLARLWSGRCSRCAKRHWTVGSCQECFAWATSLQGGRCRACREFARHNVAQGPCRSCQRTLVTNRYRRCRLCTTSRREAHLSGAPDWKVEPATRGGIQLFLGDLYHRPPRGHDRDHATTVVPTALSGRVTAWQPQMLSLPIPDGLASAVGACAQARGWTQPTTTAVIRAMALLCELGPPALTAEGLAMLRQHRLPITRVREFLDASGITSPPTARALHALTSDLPEQIRSEVTAWIEVLEGRHGRNQPRTPATIRHYLNALRPALTCWSATYGSLREVTTDEVADQLDGLHGSARTITAVALRSLFAALKARRMVFVDPAQTVKPGRFPRTPVIGLDANARMTLLAALTRADHRVVVLLAGVHALTRADIIALRLDDIDLDAAVITVRGTRRHLDRLLAATILAWLTERQQRWPASANPHLLVSYKSVYGLGPVSTAYVTRVFTQLPTNAAGLRADRLLDEAHACGGDPLRLVGLFGLSDDTAVRYCAEATLDTALTDAGTDPDRAPRRSTRTS